jgi:3-oxoacyl-[acyl-carrier-protein] synthase I
MQIKLPITSLGMVTPLGNGVVQTAGAQRAGLAFPQLLHDFPVEGAMDDEDNVVDSIVGFRISPLTDGFLQTGLWIRIAIEVLRDLFEYGNLPLPDDTAFWRKTALFIATPDVNSDRFGWPKSEISATLTNNYISPMLDLLGLDIAFKPAHIGHGHSGWAAMTCAAKGLIGHSMDRAVVLGVDSYVDQLSLGVLAGNGRLKTPAIPIGLIPGEAGAAFLVERAGHSVGRAETILLAAHHARPLQEPPSEQTDMGPFLTSIGKQLADSAIRILADTATPMPFAGDIVLDMNGEEWRARTWAAAQVGLKEHIDFDRCNLVFPCASFGEIGAASGPVGIALAARAFARGYARSEQTMVLSISENGEVGAALIGRG